MRKAKNQTGRIIKDKICLYFTLFLCFLAFVPLVSLAFTIIKNGIKYINLNMFFESQPAQMEALLAHVAQETIPGGIANGLVGGGYIILIALCIAIPLGVISGIFFYSKRHYSIVRLFSYSNTILLGIPSIITGLVIYIWIVKSLYSFSALAGGIAIAIIIFPFITRSTLQSLSKLNVGIEESCFALGADYTQTVFKILLPSVGKRLIGYISYAISIGLGEVAPLLVTALGAASINWHINRPTSSLSVQIWDFFSNPFMTQLMWSAIFILFVIILVLHIIAKLLIGKEKLYINE